MTAPLRQTAGAMDAGGWAVWFAGPFLTDWMARARDPAGGFLDALDAAGHPLDRAPRTLLAQARVLFTLAHLAQVSGRADLADAARAQAAYLGRFRKAPGLYGRALGPAGGAPVAPADRVARSYDQTFVLLALATFDRLDPAAGALAEADRVWQALQGPLTDPATGLLLEDDALDDPAAPDAPPPRAKPAHASLRSLPSGLRDDRPA